MAILCFPESWHLTISDLFANSGICDPDEPIRTQVVLIGENGSDDESLRLAIARRRAGVGVPIVAFAFQSLEADAHSTRLEAVTAELEHRIEGRTVPGLLAHYDRLVRLPQPPEIVVSEVREAAERYNEPQSIAAIETAHYALLEAEGGRFDHRLSGFAAVLRLLWGAQLDSYVEPGEGIHVIDQIAENLRGIRAEEATSSESMFLLEEVTEQRRLWQAMAELAQDGSISSARPRLRACPINAVLIDDQHIECGWRPALGFMLGRLGSTLQTHDGGPGYIDLVNDETDIVFLDLGLPAQRNAHLSPPGMEGLELFHQIREKSASVPVVFFTSYESLALGRLLQQEDAALYFVKSEKSLERDSRAYFRRFLSVTLAAIQLRFRQLLRACLEEARAVSEIARTRSCQRLRARLGELDDAPLICITSGQAIEAAMCTVSPATESLKDLIDDDVLELGVGWDPWMRLALGYRNVSAHPLNCDLLLQPFDANLAAALSVLIISKGALSSSGSPARHTSGLLRATLVACGLELIKSDTTLVQAQGESVWNLASLPSCDPQALSIASTRLLEAGKRALHRVASTVNPQRASLGGREMTLRNCCSIIREKILQRDNNRRWKPRPGLAHLSSVPQTILNVNALSCITSGPVTDDNEIMVLRLLVATRLLLWCEEVIDHFTIPTRAVRPEGRPVARSDGRGSHRNEGLGRLNLQRDLMPQSREDSERASVEPPTPASHCEQISNADHWKELQESLRWFDFDLATAAKHARPEDQAPLNLLTIEIRHLRRTPVERVDEFTSSCARILDIHLTMRMRVLKGDLLRKLLSCAGRDCRSS